MSRLIRLHRYKNNELKEMALPGLIADKLNLSEDIIKRILDMQKNLLGKKNVLNLIQNNKEEDEESEKRISFSMKSAPTPEDKQAKEMFQFLKNNKFKRTISNRKLKKPLELFENLSQMDERENKKRLKQDSYNPHKLDFLKDYDNINRSKSRLSRLNSHKGKTYLQSISESDSQDSMSAISKRSRVLGNGMEKEFGNYLGINNTFVLKSKKSISRAKGKQFQKRFSFMPNQLQMNQLRALRGNGKNSQAGKERLRKRKTIGAIDEDGVSRKSNNNSKKNSKTVYKKEKPLKSAEVQKKFSNTKSTNKKKKSLLNDYLPRDDSVPKKVNRNKKNSIGKNSIDKQKYPKNITPVKKKGRNVVNKNKNKKKKFDKPKKVTTKKDSLKKNNKKNNMKIKLNGVAMEEDDLKKSMRSDSLLSSGGSLDENPNININIRQSTSIGVPLLKIPERKPIVSRKKLLTMNNQSNIFESVEVPDNNLMTPSFPLNRRFTVNSTDIKEELNKEKGERSSKMTESLHMIDEIIENKKDLKISSNKVIFSLNSKTASKDYKESSFKNYFNLKSRNYSIKEKHHFNDNTDSIATTVKHSMISSNVGYLNTSNLIRRNTNETSRNSASKYGKKKLILLNSHITKKLEIDEYEPYRENRKNLKDTSNDFISVIDFHFKSKISSTKYFN